MGTLLKKPPSTYAWKQDLTEGQITYFLASKIGLQVVCWKLKIQLQIYAIKESISLNYLERKYHTNFTVDTDIQVDFVKITQGVCAPCKDNREIKITLESDYKRNSRSLVHDCLVSPCDTLGVCQPTNTHLLYLFRKFPLPLNQH